MCTLCALSPFGPADAWTRRADCTTHQQPQPPNTRHQPRQVGASVGLMGHFAGLFEYMGYGLYYIDAVDAAIALLAVLFTGATLEILVRKCCVYVFFDGSSFCVWTCGYAYAWE